LKCIEKSLIYSPDEITEIFNKGMKVKTMRLGLDKGLLFHVDLEYKNTKAKIVKKFTKDSKKIFNEASPLLEEYGSLLNTFRKSCSDYLKENLNDYGRKVLRENNKTIETIFAN